MMAEENIPFEKLCSSIPSSACEKLMMKIDEKHVKIENNDDKNPPRGNLCLSPYVS